MKMEGGFFSLGFKIACIKGSYIGVWFPRVELELGNLVNLISFKLKSNPNTICIDPSLTPTL